MYNISNIIIIMIIIKNKKITNLWLVPFTTTPLTQYRTCVASTVFKPENTTCPHCCFYGFTVQHTEV